VTVGFKVDSIAIDPAHEVPRLTDEFVALAEALAPWTRWLIQGDTSNVVFGAQAVH
jgi:hypothetical protein